MPFYVYIIQSQADSSYYKGFSESPLKRLLQHNNGECKYTSTKTPWTLVYIEELPTKRDALIRERGLKKYAHAQIHRLLLTDKNILKNFGSSAG
jgi:putative endonuclease